MFLILIVIIYILYYYYYYCHTVIPPPIPPLLGVYWEVQNSIRLSAINANNGNNHLGYILLGY